MCRKLGYMKQGGRKRKSLRLSPKKNPKEVEPVHIDLGDPEMEKVTVPTPLESPSKYVLEGMGFAALSSPVKLNEALAIKFKELKEELGKVVSKLESNTSRLDALEQSDSGCASDARALLLQVARARDEAGRQAVEHIEKRLDELALEETRPEPVPYPTTL